MFGLFQRRPRVGDPARILTGPYEGRVGRITSVTADPARYEVTLDECCHPVLASNELRVQRRGWLDRIAAGARRRQRSPDAGYARAPGPALATTISDLIDARHGSDRASSVLRDIQERDAARRE